jgi:hypothetical protein
LIAQQVTGNFADLVFQDPNETDYANETDMKFWFTEPSYGWRQGVARFYYLEEVPLQNVNWPKLAKIFDGTKRKSIEEYEEGAVIIGISESLHVHQGICIDFGCVFLGLIPMTHVTWERMIKEISSEKLEKLQPQSGRLDGKKFSFTCKIRRKLPFKYFRWPIELDIIEPKWLVPYIIPIGNYEPLLLVLSNNLAKIDGEEYARMSGRKYYHPRSYSYRFADYTDNNPWLQTQIDYFPRDHFRELQNYSLSSNITKMKREHEIIGLKLKVGKIFYDDKDYDDKYINWS